MIDSKKLGLSLSGGGYRAAAFHLGTMRKLDEMALLDKVDKMSTISGGSIAGACYSLRKGSFSEYEKEMRKGLTTFNVIRIALLSWSFFQLVLFVVAFLALAVFTMYTDWPWLSLIVLAAMIWLLIVHQYRIFPVGREIEKAYIKFFYQDKTLADLGQTPELVIGSTNLQTSRPFSFSKRLMEDSTYGSMHPPVEFLPERFPIAKAVFASSCVPFAFTPVRIDAKYFKNPKDIDRVQPVLVDGGVYDNQGIHKITQENSSFLCDVIITSDAGNKLPFAGSYNNAMILLIRTMNVFMERIKRFQQIENIYDNTSRMNHPIAYISLGWDLENLIPGFINNLAGGKVPPSIVAKHAIPSEWLADIPQYRNNIQQLLEDKTGYQKILAEKCTPEELELARTTGTNLTPLSVARVDALAKHAANITELQVKLYL
jgi:NTE family protein